MIAPYSRRHGKQILDIDKFIQKALGDIQNRSRSSKSSKLSGTDIYESDGVLNFEIELPGMDKGDVQVQVKDGALWIAGDTSRNEGEEENNYFLRRRSYGKIAKSFPLPENIQDPSQINAEFKKGILHVRVPLSQTSNQDDVLEVEIQ